MEPLEGRRLLAASAFANIDISRRTGNESEGAIAIDRTTPGRVFALSNTDTGTSGMFAARSTNGGRTWTGGYIADGKDDLPEACCDPSAAFDSFGNLFISYINSDQDRVEVMMSTDGGVTFEPATSFRGDVDQPTLTVGPGSVWVPLTSSNKVVVAGAEVTGLGKVDPFGELRRYRDRRAGRSGTSRSGRTGSSPSPTSAGRPAVQGAREHRPRRPRAAAVRQAGRRHQHAGRPVRRRAGRRTPAGSTPRWGWRTTAARPLPRPAVPRLHRRRAELVANTDVFLRYSDDGGATWSNPARVNDDTVLASQILPASRPTTRPATWR